jgi:hypothetical protein
MHKILLKHHLTQLDINKIYIFQIIYLYNYILKIVVNK